MIILNMIVKNEEHVIERCLDSVSGHVDDFVICDTGSTDRTPALVKERTGHYVYASSWIDFAHNRNIALEILQCKYAGSDDVYVLFLDADDQLVAGQGALSGLTADAYTIKTRLGGIEYDRVALVKLSCCTRWVGPVHEYLEGTWSSAPVLSGVTIVAGVEGARSRDPRKYEKDAEILTRDYEQTGSLRSLFYAAQSWRDAGFRDAAAELYGKRAVSGGWDEEAWYAAYQQGLIHLDHTGNPQTLLDAWQLRPMRIEPLYHLARGYRLEGAYHLAWLVTDHAIPAMPDDKLFVEHEVYRWRMADERALAAYWTGRYEVALALWRDILVKVPDSEVQRVLDNINWAQQALTSS